ncbi:amyloid fiber anchoring/assembly protein TapA [Oceanobacillus salinisoli]|uniref:amyloid fiber anchoring/assembly protein TapA n=1 Tax=Oceanobacillus salinisoli TaxID=2678611 RepID=UPI0012E2770B|nr:amyloid fiber anchoring/assembly protein TapA [Oceanobacillus salinisoli]
MRSTRVRKFRKQYWKIKTGFQLFIIWSCILLAGIYFNTYTNASFNDIEEVSARLQVQWEQEEEEWDKSSLEFSEKDSDYGFCSAEITGLFSVIKNVGDGDMAGSSEFVLHYDPDKAPNKNRPGEIIYTGTINPLESGESVILKYEPDEIHSLQPGYYKFKANHRPGHGNTDIDMELQEIWGESSITITQEDLESCTERNANKESQEAENDSIEDEQKD